MFNIKLAEHIFSIDNRFEYVKDICTDYITDESSEIVISATTEEINAKNKDGIKGFDGHFESLAVYRKICECLLNSNTLLFHCSSLAVDDKAYLFTAPSGTGKSTHARLWRECFGNRVTMINDDKPVISFEDDGIYVHGTPYSGKENLQTNTKAKVYGIVVLRQAEKNRIERLSEKDAFPLLFYQAYRPSSAEKMISVIDMVKSLCTLPVYMLSCNISKEAVMLSYNALTESEED